LQRMQLRCRIFWIEIFRTDRYLIGSVISGNGQHCKSGYDAHDRDQLHAVTVQDEAQLCHCLSFFRNRKFRLNDKSLDYNLISISAHLRWSKFTKQNLIQKWGFFEKIPKHLENRDSDDVLFHEKWRDRRASLLLTFMTNPLFTL